MDVPLNKSYDWFFQQMGGEGRGGEGLYLCFIGVSREIFIIVNCWGRGWCKRGGRSKGTLGPLGYPRLLSPICDDTKENEKPRGRSDEDNGNSKWWYLNVSNFRKTTSRTDVWYTDRFTNGFTNFETSWKASLYHLEEDGDGSYSVSNLTASWNPEIARILAVLTLSVLYFSVVWQLSLIFQ